MTMVWRPCWVGGHVRDGSVPLYAGGDRWLVMRRLELDGRARPPVPAP